MNPFLSHFSALPARWFIIYNQDLTPNFQPFNFPAFNLPVRVCPRASAVNIIFGYHSRHNWRSSQYPGNDAPAGITLTTIFSLRARRSPRWNNKIWQRAYSLVLKYNRYDQQQLYFLPPPKFCNLQQPVTSFYALYNLGCAVQGSTFRVENLQPFYIHKFNI